jgi:uncharacterized protein (DUF433 family)
MEPVFGPQPLVSGEGEPAMVSFLQLAEVVVAADFRRGSPGHPPIPLKRIRGANTYARQVLDVPYPFAHLKLEEYGGHILHEFDEKHPDGPLLALSAGGQWVLPGIVRTDIAHFDYEDELASKWFPLGRDVPIVVNPRVGAGRPTIAGTGVTVRSIQQRSRAGESAAFIAQDYGIDESAVEQALQFAA